MIYVSSSCVKHKKIKDAVLELVRHGFKNIELSGGTEYYENFEDDLLELKEIYQLNYLCHNYFPPPPQHFVLNLATLDDDVYQKSITHLLQALQLSKRLGAKRFAFHAGFFIDVKVDELGKKISRNVINDKSTAIQQFCAGFNTVKQAASGISLHIENNVYSSSNAKTYDHAEILMLTHSSEADELKQWIDFELLLDVAHLKVSCQTLGLNFIDELSTMMARSDYIHLSDNDGLHDLNAGISENSSLYAALKTQPLNGKTLTLEVYSGIDQLQSSYELITGLIND